MQAGKFTQAPSGMEFLELVRSDLQRVDREIERRSISSVNAITSIGNYLHSSGGKRLRPALLLLCSKLVCGETREAAIGLAAVVEMIHAATLVHDDVIDVAETRRGRPSPNVLWGNQTSVLAGDWLYMQAFQIALEHRDFRILDILIGLTQTMVEGELLQLERLGSASVTEADYMDLVHRKTAALFSACARLGALVAGADPAVEGQLSDFAWNLGMAFQLVDDVLDFTAQQDVLGKPVGSDLREGKVTLPLIYALEAAEEGERLWVESVVRLGDGSREAFAEVQAFIRKYRGIERSMARAEGFTEAARQILASFPESPCQRALYALTEAVTVRDH